MSWLDDAACRGMDPDLFFPDERNTVPPAAALACSRCAVDDECLADAFATGERHGIRGGMTGPERRRSGKLARRPRMADVRLFVGVK